MNYLTVAGHLGADAEVRFTSTGKKVTTLRVAARLRKAAAGGDDTIWWRVSLWGDQFDKLVPYLKKGSAVIVFGDMHKPEIFTNRDGKSQISLDMTGIQVQLSPFGKPDRGTNGAEPSMATVQEPSFGGHGYSKPASPQAFEEFNDEEVPF